jgi:uncharacterized membrane protein
MTAAHEVPKESWGEIDQSVSIARPAGELYDIWRNLDSLPDILSHVKLVREITPMLSHWVVDGPLGTDVTWDSIITEEIPGQRLAWRSVEGSEVDNEGSVDFHASPGSLYTEIRVLIRYNPPAGALGKAVAALLGKDPNGQVADDLQKFKEAVEADRFVHRSR